MTVDQIEIFAQVGENSACLGLADAVDWLFLSCCNCKERQRLKVKLVEVLRPSPSLKEALIGLGELVFGLEKTVEEVLHELTYSGRNYSEWYPV